MTTDIQIKVIDSATWKLKILNAVIKFLNWMTIPNAERKKGDMVINVKIEAEIIK